MSTRILLVAVCVVAFSSTAFAQGRANHATASAAVVAQQKRLAEAEEKRVQGNLNWLEQQIAKEEKVLRHRLKQAEGIRAAGIKSENNTQMKQAAAIEQNAFDAYSKRVAILEKTTAKAVSVDQAKAAANAKKAAAKKSAPKKSSPRLFRLFD